MRAYRTIGHDESTGRCYLLTFRLRDGAYRLVEVGGSEDETTWPARAHDPEWVADAWLDTRTTEGGSMSEKELPDGWRETGDPDEMVGGIIVLGLAIVAWGVLA